MKTNQLIKLFLVGAITTAVCFGKVTVEWAVGMIILIMIFV